MKKDSKILITGGTGLIGTALTEYLCQRRYSNVLSIGSADCDLKNMDSTNNFFEKEQPEFVYHLAATVYGIMGNLKNQGSSFLENSLINLNVIEAARRVNVKKIVVMVTCAAYPDSPLSLPLKEDEFWFGKPHYSEYGYAQAKRSMLANLISYRDSYGISFSYVISTNIYGPNDRFNLENGHVMPSLVKKFYEAKKTEREVEVWGDGSTCRDFLYSEDAARALYLIMESVDGPINMASGKVNAIKDIVDWLAEFVHLKGKVKWDDSKPKGRCFREFDLTKLGQTGFKPEVDIESGVRKTYDWYERYVDVARS